MMRFSVCILFVLHFIQFGGLWEAPRSFPGLENTNVTALQHEKFNFQNRKHYDWSRKPKGAPDKNSRLNIFLSKIVFKNVNSQKAIPNIYTDNFSKETLHQNSEYVNKEKLNVGNTVKAPVLRNESKYKSSHGGDTLFFNQTVVSTRRQQTALKRHTRSTSKFLGIVVGASSNSKLKADVKKLVEDIQNSIWNHQLLVTKSYDVGNDKLATVQGAFVSDVVTNFHGKPNEAKLRGDKRYVIRDVNSISSLLILQCLVEATLYGAAPIPRVSNLTLAIKALEDFHTHSYPKGSTILSAWPEKVSNNGNGFVIEPSNLVKSKVKDKSTYGQMKAIVKDCPKTDCTVTAQGLKGVQQIGICKEHFSSPLPGLVQDLSTSSDFMTSLSNLALGSLLHAVRSEEKTNDKKPIFIFPAELKQWKISNRDIATLVSLLKKSVIKIEMARITTTRATVEEPTTTQKKDKREDQPLQSITTTSSPSSSSSSSSPSSSPSPSPPPQLSTTFNPPPTKQPHIPTTSNNTNTKKTNATNDETTANVLDKRNNSNSSNDEKINVSNNMTKNPHSTETQTPPTTTNSLQIKTSPPVLRDPTTQTLSPPTKNKQEKDNSHVKVDINIRVTLDTRKKQEHPPNTSKQSAATSHDTEMPTSGQSDGGHEIHSDMKPNSKSLEYLENNKTLNSVPNASREILSVSGASNSTVASTNGSIAGTVGKNKISLSNSSILSDVHKSNSSTGQGDSVHQKVSAILIDKILDVLLPSKNASLSKQQDDLTSSPEGKVAVERKVENEVNIHIEDSADAILRNGNDNDSYNNDDKLPKTNNTNVDDEHRRFRNNKTFDSIDTTTTSGQTESLSSIPPERITTAETPPLAKSTTTTPTPPLAISTTTTPTPPDTTPSTSTTTKPTLNSPGNGNNVKKKPTETKESSQTTAPPKTTSPRASPEQLPILDAVSYFGIREFLDDEIQNRHHDVYLIPLRIPRPENSPDHSPWPHYNEVDPTVTASSVHALLIATVSRLVDMQDDTQLQLIFRSSIRLLTWLMSHQDQLETATHISYFPSRFQLYWMTSRIAFHLNMEPVKNRHLFDFAENDINDFLKSLRNGMTMAILSSIRDDGLSPDGQTRVYVDDFIGTDDLTSKGKKKVSGHDRLFTSAMAANALISTWSSPTFESDGLLQFHKETPDSVRIAVNSLVNYISKAVLAPEATLMNAYISEKVKGCQTLPSWFPFNKVTSTVNGDEVRPMKASESLRFGVEGHVPISEYQQEMKKTRFGLKLPTMAEINNLNQPTSVFRFWSSDDLTRAACILAIAQAADLKVDESIGSK